MRRPNLKSLNMFDAAARHLNFQRAADELNLTQ
ncbi:MAG: LysR family transcriptional regulator, partial [Granulosicoccaceae bacterium]